VEDGIMIADYLSAVLTSLTFFVFETFMLIVGAFVAVFGGPKNYDKFVDDK